MKQRRQDLPGSEEGVEEGDEVCCPTCEASTVQEMATGCACARCGQTWVTALLRK